MISRMTFDHGDFSLAEGNIPSKPGSFLRRATARSGGDYSWSTPRLPRQSILTKTMRCPTMDSFAAFADTTSFDDPEFQLQTNTSPGVAQPPNSANNTILNSISGLVASLGTAGAKRITTQGSGSTNKTSANALMQQYLQGRLPNHEINPQTGQLQPKSSSPWGVIAAVVGGALVLGLAVKALR